MDAVKEKTLVGEVVKDTPSVPVTRTRWLTLTVHAPIQVVAFANYLRFGPAGVRHFGPGAEESALAHPHTLTVHLSVKQIGGDTLLNYPDFILQHSRPHEPFDLDGTTIWYGQDEAAHLRVLWVWDFYRLFGGMKLAVEVPPDKGKWQEVAAAIRKVRPGNQIIAALKSGSGDILQVYPIDAPAVEQEY